MNKKCLGVLLVLCLVCLVGSLIVSPKSLSASSIEISKDGYYALSGGTSVHLNGISCSYIHDFTGNMETITATTDCGNSGVTIPSINDNYLFVIKDKGATCSGLKIDSPSKMDAECYIYTYDKPYASISCNKNMIPTGDYASCTLKITTSSDGFKSLNVDINSDNLNVGDFESSLSTVTNIGNEFVFTANSILDTKKEYILANFNVYNNSINDGNDNTITFSYVYNDNIANLELGVSNLSFAEDKTITTTTTTKKITTTKAKTTTRTVVVSGVDTSEVTTTLNSDVSTTLVSDIDATEEGLVVDTETKSNAKTNEDDVGLSGGAAVLLTTFVSTMSIASGIGIALFAKKLKL